MITRYLALIATVSAVAATPAVAQSKHYSASGFHQCGTGHSCVVSGLFNDCKTAAISLATRDCCPTTPGGGASTGFTLSYCIPDSGGN